MSCDHNIANEHGDFHLKYPVMILRFLLLLLFLYFVSESSWKLHNINKHVGTPLQRCVLRKSPKVLHFTGFMWVNITLFVCDDLVFLVHTHVPICRCRLGWEGADCGECRPHTGCLQGYCHQPYQCICINGWTGTLCDIGEY